MQKLFFLLWGQITESTKWRPGKLALNTATMTAGLGFRALAQAVVFLIVARVLGIQGYGAFIAVLALAGALSGFVGFGMQTLMVRDVACDKTSFPLAWSRTLTAVAISIPFILGAYLVIAWLVLPPSIPVVIVAFVGIAEIVFVPLTAISAYAYQGHERMGRAARLIITPFAMRLVSAVLFAFIAILLSPEDALLTWGFFYIVTNLIAAVYALVLVSRDLGLPAPPPWRSLFSTLNESIPFSLAGPASRLYSDIDKTMLARFTTLEITGAYSAGYRVLDLVILPLTALLSASIPRFFRAGHGGAHGTLAYARRILPIPLAYALVACTVLYFSAGLLPLILGQNYIKAIGPLQMLAGLPLMSTLRLFAQTALSTSAHQKLAVIIVVGGAVINIILNSLLIPAMSWRGAVISTYISEGLMTIAMFMALRSTVTNKTS